MKKIFVNKNEGVAEVVEKIIGEEEADLILVVPKDSRLKESASNFHLIKREAASSGKNILLESVDEEILMLARASDLDAARPFFEGEHKGPSLSDIVPARAEEERRSSAAAAKSQSIEDGQPPPAIHAEPRPGKATSRVFHEAADAPQKAKSSAGAFTARAKGAEVVKIVSGAAVKRGFIAEKISGRRINFKLMLVIAIPVLVIAAVFLVVNNFFNKADITINFTKIPWNYERAFSADKSVSALDFSNNILPGEVFSDSKNTVQLYPASSHETVSEKAQGTITIYNAYSSSPQTLVATTRFATSDGKIFRIEKAIVVPGAQITNGNITPSSIVAQVVADKTGAEYNIGPTSRLTIPGFKGTPRYNGFYGELKQGTSGGFVGVKAMPTADDIARAKAGTTAVLRNTFDNPITSAYPANCKILDGAEQFNITDMKVNTDTNASGSFSVIGRATNVVLCFRESGDKSLKSLLSAVAAKNNPNMVFDDLQISYNQIKADPKNGKETFYVTASGTLKPDFSADDFKSSMLGRKVGDARSLLAALPNLASAKISLWPFWLWSVPANPNRVKIIVN